MREGPGVRMRGENTEEYRLCVTCLSVVIPSPLAPRSLYFSSCHPKFFFSFPPFPFIFIYLFILFFVSAAGHLVSHMDGVILEESPRESLLKPPFVLGVEKSIVVVEKDLDKIRTVSIQDCLISP